MARCFTNIELSEEQRARVAELQGELRNTGAHVKWVEKKNLHITLNFLGDVPEEKLRQVEEECRAALAGRVCFNVSLKGVGAFPNFNHLKVLWVGVDAGNEDIIELANVLRESIMLGKKGDNFHPHVTIGRVRSARNKDKLVSMLDEYKNAEFGSSEVDKVTLKKSTLTPHGPVYEDVFEIGLEQKEKSL